MFLNKLITLRRIVFNHIIKLLNFGRAYLIILGVIYQIYSYNNHNNK